MSSRISLNNVKEFSFKFLPTYEMMPQANVLIYYIRSDGEIISDLIEVKFKQELRSFIDIKLSRTQAKPGQNLSISIKTNPDSFVGLLGVDQSVLLMKTGNDIDKSSVFAELERYMYPNRYNSEYWESGDNFYDFQLSSLRIISNAKREFNSYGKNVHEI